MTGDRRLGLVTAQSHATHGKTRRGDYRPALAHGWQRRSDSPLGLSELRLNPAFRRKERKKLVILSKSSHNGSTLTQKARHRRLP